MKLPGFESAERSPLRKADLWAGLALLVCVAVSWCAASSLWDGDVWSRPTAYSAPFTSDVLTTLAGMKSVANGHVYPLAWKTIPELGAPSGGNWNDYPIIEEIPLYFQGLLGKTFGLFAGLNLALLTGHLLAAAVFYLVARFSDVDRRWSFVGAFAYGLAPFLFAQSPHHITVAWAWHVPLFIPVWKWAVSGSGLVVGSKRFWIAVGIAVLTGLQNVYYTNIFCQLTLLGGVVSCVRRKSPSPLLGGLGVVAAAALAFGLMNLDTWSYRLVHGANAGAVVREYKWLEIYGLKIVDLVVPPLTHHSDLLAAFAFRHRSAAPLQDEGSYLGLIGLFSLGLVVVVSLAAILRKRYAEIPLAAWQVLWILVVFTTGGLNAIVGALGFTMFRTGCRYSIVILAVVLLFSMRWMTALPLRQGLARFVALLAVLLVFWDQVPRGPDPGAVAQVDFQIESDREIVEKMEEVLPVGAMVFQLPVMDFPESPVPGLSPYDHLRPYLFSKNLRFSFGSMKGRADTQWQGELTKFSLGEAVKKMREMGFQALLINRNGFPDKARGILKSLSDMGFSRIIESPAGDLVCVIL